MAQRLGIEIPNEVNVRQAQGRSQIAKSRNLQPFEELHSLVCDQMAVI